MPELPQHSGAVDTITLPHTGVKITLRRVANAGDKREALEAVRDGRSHNSRQAYMRYLGFIAASLMTEWDATGEDGKVLPISPQELAAMKDEDDYQFLLDDVAKRVTLREAADPDREENFEPPSTQSSPATSSKTRKTTRTS